MWSRSTLSLLTLVPLLSIAATQAEDGPPESRRTDAPKSASQQFCERLYHQWLRIHTAAARRGDPVRADLRFDPKAGTIMVDRGAGEPTTAETLELPPGMTWHAFHVSGHGIRRLAFPVVLQRPYRFAKRSPQDDEEIWIFGRSKNAHVHFHVGSRTTGPTAGGGRGWHSKRGAVKVGMRPIRDANFRSQVSMLSSEALRERPAEWVEIEGARVVEVMRESAL